MICAMVNQLTKNATLKELEEAGLASYYADHNKGIYPVNVSDVAFTADPIADLMEDMAAEQKARAVYEILSDNIFFVKTVV